MLVIQKFSDSSSDAACEILNHKHQLRRYLLPSLPGMPDDIISTLDSNSRLFREPVSILYALPGISNAADWDEISGPRNYSMGIHRAKPFEWVWSFVSSHLA